MMMFLMFLLVVGSAMARLKDLTGNHYKFTVIHDPPYMDVGYSDGSLLTEDAFTGYIPDMIHMVANKAGFTYEMMTPTGNGSSCTSNGGGLVDYAVQYGCGQQDTLELNHTEAYWSMYYVTSGRMDSGTLFTAPFMTGAGLGLLTLPNTELTTIETTLLIFKPFSPMMWGVTILMVAFSACVVWLSEQINMPSRKANRMLESILGSVHRTKSREVETKLTQEVHNSTGLLSFPSFVKWPSYFLGTFGGLMSASDDSENDTDERVTPSGNFAAAWGFFVLFWASAYTANLAATLTLDAGYTGISSLEEMSKNRHTACARAGAAYTAGITTAFPQINVKLYDTVSDEYQALLKGHCDAVVDTFPVLNGIANGVVDLDLSSDTNYCSAEDKVVVSDKPRSIGLTDMAVGVSRHYPELHEVLDYWVSSLRTCNPYAVSSECYQGGTAGALNLEVLRAMHVEKEACGDTTEDDVVGAPQLTVANFLFPILAVVIAGTAVIGWYYWTYLRKIGFYLASDDLEELLTKPKYNGSFVQVDKGRRALMLDTLMLILDNDDEGRINTIHAAAKHFLYTDMESFFLLVRLAHVMCPGMAAGELSDHEQMQFLHTAGELSTEVIEGTKLLVQRAIVSFYKEGGSFDNFTFVCRDDIQFNLMRESNFGMHSKEKAMAALANGDDRAAVPML